jgi:HPt (histidine-containing phosphotransfer) domain-containing protein
MEKESDRSPVAIDWVEAKSQVEGDLEFLQEVLQDLIEEANTAVEDIQAGIDKRDFEKIMKAAHRIKGSATYLGCEALRVASYQIQQLGHDAISQTDSDDLLRQIKGKYSIFLDAFEELKRQIEIWQEDQSMSSSGK